MSTWSKPRRCPFCEGYFTKPRPWPGTVGVCPLCGTVLPKSFAPRNPKPANPKKTKTSRSKKRVRRLMARDGTNCWLCGARLSVKSATLDHVIPRSKGGTDALANLRLACRPCNNQRGNTDA